METRNDKLDRFTTAYLVCALWSSVQEDGSPFDDDYSIDDFSEETLKEVTEECSDFRTANAELLEQSGLDDEQAGHDFWLTRNHHGAGFWDRGLGETGRILTDAAHVYGSVDVYVGDDEKLHIQ
jgi:hypothetical protein